MKRVYVASPFRGATPEQTRQNIIYARLCMLDSLARGEAPYLSHLLYTQVWDERNRDLGLMAGDAWRAAADGITLYVDLGVTSGMERAIAAQLPKQFLERRNVHWRAAGWIEPLDTIAAWRERLGNLGLRTFPELDPLGGFR
jgi:hypothetical protein